MVAIRTKIGESYHYLHKDDAGKLFFLPVLKAAWDWETDTAAQEKISELSQLPAFTGYFMEIIKFTSVPKP